MAKLNILFNNNLYIKFTKEIYEKQSEYEKTINNFYCPDEYPYLCTINSQSFGLCKKTPEDCLNINSPSKIPIVVNNNSNNNLGKLYGYDVTHLHNRCNRIYKDYEYITDNNYFIPNNFKIMTYNIWGLFNKSKNTNKNDFLYELMKIRMKGICDEILKNKPDILCFQEMSTESYNLICEHIGDKYKYKFETDFDINKNTHIRDRHVEVHVFSKYPVNNVTIYGMDGNQHYRDSFMIVEFSNLVIFNCYLQSGSKLSPGQENYWYHYSRLRCDQLKKIKEKINNYNKSVILVGDFNFHLDGNYYDWIETKELEEFNDSWRILNKNDSGYTEDTEINDLRWNLKFQAKQLRYDGIFYKNLIPIKSWIIGNTCIELTKENSEKFKNLLVLKNNRNKIRYNKNGLINIFPSDHFGVITEFQLE